MKLCSLHSASFLRKHKVQLWSSPGFLAGCHRVSDTNSEHRWGPRSWNGKHARGHKNKLQTTTLTMLWIARAEQTSFSLVRDSVVEASLVTSEAKTGTTIHDEKLGSSLHFCLENYRNVLWSYNAITFTPTLPGITLTPCPQQPQSLDWDTKQK